jgi:hypothetical protein
MKIKLILNIIFFSQICAEISGISGAFTDIGYSAKSISMGLVQSTLNQGAIGSILNPASLGFQNEQHSLSISNFKLGNFDNYTVVAYSTKLTEKIPIGIFLISSGDELWRENQIGLSSGFKILDDLNIGMSCKIYTVSAGNNDDGQLEGFEGELQVSGSGFGLGLDSGIQYKLDENQQIAFVIKNLFSTVKYSSKGGGGFAEGNYSEGIPAQYTLGYRISNNSLTALVDIVDGFKGESPAELRVGSEWNVYKNILCIRSGIRTELMTGENTMYGLGTGLKFNPKSFGLGLNLGYFFRPNGVDMNELRFELEFELN